MTPLRALLVVPILALAIGHPAHAQDAFGLDPGVASGTLHDPLTGHSPWTTTGGRLQAHTTFGYAHNSVYGCEVSPETGTCIDGVAPWVAHDVLAAGGLAGHFLDGRLTLDAGARARVQTLPGEGLPDVLVDAGTFEGASLADVRLSGRMVLLHTDRLAIAPVASLRFDRETHLIADDRVVPPLTAGPLYGLGNGVSAAVPVGLSPARLPIHLVADAELGLDLTSLETSEAVSDVGLNPVRSWGRLRAGGDYTLADQVALLAELEGRFRQDAVLNAATTSIEARAGVRTGLASHRLQLTALVGHSPMQALGSPAFRGVLGLRYRGANPDAVAIPEVPPGGRVLTLTVTTPDGTPVVPEVSLDGAPALLLPSSEDGLQVIIPDTAPHRLSLRHPGSATLQQTIEAPDTGAWALHRVLPPGDGDGVLVLDLQDPSGTPLTDASLQLTPRDGPTFDLGQVCGDCDLRFSELPVGPYALGLTAPGMSAATVPLTVRTTAPEAPASTIFLAPPPGQLHIRVRDDSGQPLPGADVRLIHSDGVSSVPLDPSGHAMPVVAPGRWLLDVAAPGRGRQQVQVDVEPFIPIRHDLFVDLLPEADTGARLHVEVVDADGDPVAGARVVGGDQVLATTSTGGKVALDGLPEGPLPLRIEHPDFRAEPDRLVQLAAGEETGASFALGWQPGAVVLKVVSPDGRPVDSTVRLEGPGEPIVERTGPDGRTSQMLDSGLWRAELVDADHLPVGVSFELTPQRNTVVKMQLVQHPAPTEGTAALAVSVVDEADRPIEGATVQLGDVLLGTTSTTGELTVRGIPAGDTVVDVQGQYFDPWSEAVAVDPSVPSQVQASLRSRLGVVELIAVDPEAAPIEAQVRVTGAGGQTRLSRLGVDGRRTYRLAQGYWEFAFASERHGFGVEDLTVEREQAAYEVRWVGTQGQAPTVLAPPARRPVQVQLWSRPADAPTPGTLRMLGPDVLPPFEVGADGIWEGTLRPGMWEALATAPELGIGGGDLPLDPGLEPASLRVELGQVSVELTSEELTIDDTLYFAIGSADLEPAARASLQAVARTLRANPRVRSVRVEGHADQSGSAAVNQRLSEARAHAVMDALIALGVEPHRLTAEGFGETHAAGRASAQDRRVVFRVVEVRDAVQLSPTDDTAP